MFYWLDKTLDYRQQLETECPGVPDSPALYLAAWVIQLPEIATTVLVFMSFFYTDEIHLLSAHALLVNGFFTWAVSAMLPEVNNAGIQCQHNVDDRPCEEMSIMTTLLFFSFLYDAHRPTDDRVLFRQRAMFLTAGCVLLGWALIYTGLFEAEEVAVGAVVGMFSAGISATLVFLIIKPYLQGHPVARYAALKFGITQSREMEELWRNYSHLRHQKDGPDDATPWQALHNYIHKGKRLPLKVPVGVVYEPVEDDE